MEGDGGREGGPVWGSGMRKNRATCARLIITIPTRR